MEIYQIILIIFSSLCLLAIAGYIIYIYFWPITPIKPSSNIIQPEVFLVKIHGSNKLGNSQLSGSFVYATNDVINLAIKAGLRATLSAGDIILYVDPDSTYNNELPNACLASGTEFSSSDNITLSNNVTGADTSNKVYWACIYGYKPIQLYAQFAWMIFAYNQSGYIISSTDYYGIQSFSPLVWNQPQSRSAIDSKGCEVIWVSFANGTFIPQGKSNFNNLLLDQNFQLATVDQYMWAYSNGIGQGWNQTIYCATSSSNTDDTLTMIGSILAPSLFNNGIYTCRAVSDCAIVKNKNVAGNVMALWGIRANLKNISTMVTNVIQFNSTKNSQYN